MNPELPKVAILLNGPPRAGKDTAVAALDAGLAGAGEVIKFTRPVKDRTHAEAGLEVSHDHYEELKDTPLPEFGGRTPRQAYIDTSAALKAARGEDAVAILFVEAALSSPSRVILNPDCGDDMEALSVAGAFGTDRTLVVRISRKGHDFSNDCRTWVTDASLTIVDVENTDGNPEAFQAEVVAHVTRFLDSLGQGLAISA